MRVGGVTRWAAWWLGVAVALGAAGCAAAESKGQTEAPVVVAKPVLRWEAAVLGGTVFVVDGASLRAVSATLGPGADVLASLSFTADERPSSPVVRREPLGVDSAEVFITVSTETRCTLRALTRRLDPVWSREVSGACAQPGVEGEALLWPVADASGARVELLAALSGQELGFASLPAAPVAPAARMGDASARWVVPLLDGAALVGISAASAPVLLDVLPLADLRPTSALAPGGDRIVITAAESSSTAAAHLGDRLVRVRVTAADTLEQTGQPIVTPSAMEAAPIGASPDCTAATGGSHWWCGGGGFVATGGSHWLGGFDLATGASLFDVMPPQSVVHSLSLGADGRIYTGGSHWLGGYELQAFDPLAATGPGAFQLVFARPEAPTAYLPSVAFTCGARVALLVEPGAGAAELVLTDADATSAPLGTWARPFGGGDNSGQSATPDACELAAPASACGDGVLDEGEACDDGNTVDEPVDTQVRCSADCRVERQLVSEQVQIVASLLSSGPHASVRSVRVRYLSRGVRVYGELCLPNSAGPFPVLLFALEGPETTGHIWASELCWFAASQGAIVAAAQSRGRGVGSSWPSEGSVEVCRGEVDDVAGIVDLALALPEAAAGPIGAVGAGFGACTVTEFALRGAKDGAASPPVGAAVLTANFTDAAALHSKHAAEPPPAPLSPLIAATLEDATGGTPPEAPVAYALRSPAQKAKALYEAGTALMLVHAMGDPNWPIAQTCALRAGLHAAGAEFFEAQVYAGGLGTYVPAELATFKACPDMGFATADPAWASVDYALIAIQDTATYELGQLGMFNVVQRMVDFLKSHETK
ncbi:MAG: prolyl oligopeptidase family serine peptidase [Myxococcota bacterium]